MHTRSQDYSRKVFDHIFPMKEAIDNEQNGEKKSKKMKAAKEYGSLCHDFPVMVLRSGLSQAVAFLLVKSESRPAHKKLLEHLALLLGQDLNQFQTIINTASLKEYQSYTRKILAASIWYKRFADSLLNVKADQGSSDDSGSSEEDENASN